MISTMALRRPAAQPDADTADEAPTTRRRDEDDAPVAKKAAKKAPKADDIFEDEDEDEVPARSSVVQSGWGAAKKAVKSAKSEQYANDFRWTEDQQVVKFLTTDPFVYLQHWVERDGKKGFVCLGDEDGCPLCDAGSKVSPKFVFSVLNLSAEPPVVEMLNIGSKLLNQLSAFHEDTKTGPLDRLWWALSASGKRQQKTYNIVPIKDRDLEEDWDIEVDLAEELVSKAVPLDQSAIYVTPASELRRIAHEDM